VNVQLFGAASDIAPAKTSAIEGPHTRGVWSADVMTLGNKLLLVVFARLCAGGTGPSENFVTDPYSVDLGSMA